jgi:hypothetical protein
MAMKGWQIHLQVHGGERVGIEAWALGQPLYIPLARDPSYVDFEITHNGVTVLKLEKCQAGLVHAPELRALETALNKASEADR